MSKNGKVFSIINNILFIITGSVFCFFEKLTVNLDKMANINSTLSSIMNCFIKFGWIFSIVGILITMFKLIKKDNFIYEKKYNFVILLFNITSILLIFKSIILAFIFYYPFSHVIRFLLLISYILIIIYSIINTNLKKEKVENKE